MRHGSESEPRVCPKRWRVTKRQSPRLSAAASRRSWPKRCGDSRWCGAIAPRGVGGAHRGWLHAADCYFRESRALPERVGDAYLRGLCLVNHAEVDVTRQRFEDARQKAEEALAVFDQLGAQSAKAEAYRVIGMVYRETGRIVLAESRLRSAIELAATAGA